MKTKKLLKRLVALTNARRRRELAELDNLKAILDKLEKKEVKLRKKLEGEDNDNKKARLERKLKVVDAQRKKGLARCEELMAEQ